MKLDTRVTMKEKSAIYSEQEIITGCISGIKEYNEILYKKYSRDVYGICLRYVRENGEALDLMHDCFIKVFLNIKKFRQESSLKTWICRIAVNETLQYLKKDLKKHFVSDASLVEIPENDLQYELIEDKEITNEEILSAIQKLPVGYKTVLNLFAIENFSHLQIAKKLGISINTSKTQLHKARKYLNEILNRNNNE